MADTKITALTAITTVDPAVDVLPIVDVSDTTMAASGTTKKITSNQILGAGCTATLASATITGDLTVRTNQLKVDSVGVGIGTTDTTTGKLCVNTGDGTVCFRNFSLILGSGTGAGIDFLNAARSAVVDGGIRATNLTLNSFGANPLILQTDSTERYRIASDGVATWSNVGGVAGTAMTLNSTGLGVGGSPSNNLHIKGASGATAIRLEAITDGTLGFIGSASGLITGSPANNLVLRAENGLYLSGGGNATQFILNSSGNVGIGVTPLERLTVAGTGSFGGTGNTGIKFHSASPLSNNLCWLLANDQANSNVLNLYYYSAGVFSGRAFVVNQSGNFMVRTPATPPTIPDNEMMVFNLTSNTNLRISVKGTDGTTRTANITLA